MTVDEIMRKIDDATEPKAMSKLDALEFIERIETELVGRKEALRDELDNED